MQNWKLGWKTILGGVLLAGAHLLAGPTDTIHIVQALSEVLAIVGMRHAIAKVAP